MMNKILLIIIVISQIFVSCNSVQKVAGVLPELSEPEGAWELKSIAASNMIFDGLYPNQKPFIVFDSINLRVSGFTGCNTFAGKYRIAENKFEIVDQIIMTKKACINEPGESIFMNAINLVDSFAVDNDNVLRLLAKNRVLMSFVKIQVQ